MTVEQYKLRAAIFREHMEKPMPPMDLGSVTATKEYAYLPGGMGKSMVPEAPPSEGDLSHMNPRPPGMKGGRPRKTITTTT